MNAGPEMEASLCALLARFCQGIAARDAHTVLQLLDSDAVIVTSEEALVRGRDDVNGFIQRYARGNTAYVWAWDRVDVSAAGNIGWLVAEGSETETSGGSEHRRRYRMTMVFERRGDRLYLLHVHGSPPYG